MEKMKIKNVLVTGASGKVGRNTIPELIKAGYKIRALQYETPVSFPGVEVVKGDLGDPKIAKKLVEDMDAVVHLANVKENKEKFLKANINGTFYLLDAIKESKSVKQLVQAGSDARAGIYFNPRPYVIDENFPHSAYPGYYAFSKVLEETMCEQFRIQYGLPITILRFSWVHDEDDILVHATLKEPNFGIPVWKDLAKAAKQKEFFKKKLDGAALLRHTNGKPCMRHIVGIKDVVQSVVIAVGNQASIGHAFAVCAPAPFTYDVLANYVSERLSIPVVEFTYDKYNDFQHSLAKSRSILGYKPEYDIIKIVDDAAAFRKSGRKRTRLKYPG
ncbi:MAG: hypothetical protein A2252_06095 [Elusimicrobia bacterium RIFOXYA2_FULL_39_19]|nr:MAG: hypothetical protein A2252_06095 [Elusimicrobia bacterium RIFOXYA2_FULL_39_19]